MFVIRLPNGNLMAPESAVDRRGEVVGDAYVEIGPADPDYARLAVQAMSEREIQDRRRRWRDGDEALRRQFEEFLAGGGQAGGGQAGGGQAGRGQAGGEQVGGRQPRTGEDPRQAPDPGEALA